MSAQWSHGIVPGVASRIPRQPSVHSTTQASDKFAAHINSPHSIHYKMSCDRCVLSELSVASDIIAICARMSAVVIAV